MSKRTQPFNPKLVVGLIAAGLAAFAALVLLLAFGSALNQPGGSQGRGHALSRAATGFSGLVTLASNFRETRLVREQSDLLAENLLVVTLEPQSNPGEFQRLIDRRGARPTLVILPKWATLADSSHRGWVRALGPGAGAISARLIGKDISIDVAQGVRAALVEGRGFLKGVAAPVPDQPQTISGGGIAPLVEIPGAGAVLARVGEQPLYVASDPDLFDNHGLRDPATARAALAILDALNETGARRIDFDLTMNGYGARADDHPNMLRTALEPPFLAITLALVVAALLAGLHGAFRFGPARREARALPFGKAALVENSAGLIRLAGREATLGDAYAEVLRQEFARAAAAPQWLTGDKLDAYLDRLTRPGSDSFSTLALRLRHAHDRGGLIEAARALFQWKKDAIR